MNDKNMYVRLLSGFDMPLIGFGTYKIQGKDMVYNVIDKSLEVGFRSIDTAAVYNNEKDIGYALKELLPKHNLKRKDIFITTKLAPSDNGKPDNIKKAVENSLNALGITYIDLYLIHWPGTERHLENSPENKIFRDITWRTLAELQKSGVLRSIGVSNYTVKHLTQLLENCYNVKPAVNQVELHPYFRQEELIKFCEKEEIHVQAYSSLGTSNSRELLENLVVCKIATEIGISPARLLLKWALQQGIGIIPKAIKPEHIEDNIKLDFNIEKHYMIELSNLSQQKFSWDPEVVF